MNKIIKVILAVLFFLCLLDMPYGYYQLVRFIATGSFLFLAFNAYTTGNKNYLFLYVGLAVLFQPLFKIALGRQVWNIVDVAVAIFLIASLFPNFLSKLNHQDDLQ